MLMRRGAGDSDVELVFLIDDTFSGPLLVVAGDAARTPTRDRRLWIRVDSKGLGRIPPRVQDLGQWFVRVQTMTGVEVPCSVEEDNVRGFWPVSEAPDKSILYFVGTLKEWMAF